MRIAIISPFNTGPSRGNTITVRRIAKNLPSAGCLTNIVPLDTMEPVEQLDLLQNFRPDILHSFHAFYSGPSAQHFAEALAIPYVITITGSDLFSETMRTAPETISAISGATAIICFDNHVTSHFTETFPDASTKTEIIPQGVALMKPSRPANQRTGNPLLLLPAAMRPVKGILEAIDALEPLTEKLPEMQLILAGGSLDPHYAEKVRKRVEKLPWVSIIGDVPHSQMADLYASADIVLNSSIFEGGMANALLEAMAAGKPVVARDIPGNRGLIQHGKTGWLYITDGDLRQCVLDLADQPDQHDLVGRAAQEFVLQQFSIQSEVFALAGLYCKILKLHKPEKSI